MYDHETPRRNLCGGAAAVPDLIWPWRRRQRCGRRRHARGHGGRARAAGAEGRCERQPGRRGDSPSLGRVPGGRRPDGPVAAGGRQSKGRQSRGLHRALAGRPERRPGHHREPPESRRGSERSAAAGRDAAHDGVAHRQRGGDEGAPRPRSAGQRERDAAWHHGVDVGGGSRACSCDPALARPRG